MLRPTLVNYIKQQLNAGYNTNTIKSHLLKHGYKLETINEHLNYISPTQREVKHVIHLSKSTMLFITISLVFIVLIGSLTYLYLKPLKPAKQLLDLKIDVLTTSVKPGDTLKFNIELSNLGVTKRYDVLLLHQILDKNLITSKEETIAVETKTSSKSEIKIPVNTKPGSYTIKTTARYNGKIATATEIFKVIKESIKPNCFDGIQNQDEENIDCGGICAPCEEERKCPETCDDFNTCTRDYCNEETNYLCNYKPITPCCGNNICEPEETLSNCAQDCKEAPEEDIFEGLSIFEKLNRIKEIAKTDPESAGLYCSQITQEIYKNDCFSNLAETTGIISTCNLITRQRAKEECYSKVAIKIKDSSVCNIIITSSRKDNCYMNFVQEEDYSVCNELQNDYLKQSCNALRTLQEMNQTIT